MLERFARIDVARYAEQCGVDEDLIRAAARRIADAGSVSVFEDLGIQQGPNSTLCSYVNRMLWILTGNFGNPGGMHLHTVVREPVPRPARSAARRSRARGSWPGSCPAT